MLAQTESALAALVAGQRGGLRRCAGTYNEGAIAEWTRLCILIIAEDTHLSLITVSFRSSVLCVWAARRGRTHRKRDGESPWLRRDSNSWEVNFL